MTHINLKHLVLSGGGLLGISYIGLFKYFEEKNVIKTIESITGSSAGAIFGALLALGYTSNELINIFKQVIFKDYLQINVDSILNFTTQKGFESGNKLNLFIKKCIYNKTNNENLTFIQLYEKYNINLQIGVTNLTQHKFELLNKDSYPDLPIHKAISASIAIPFILEPIIINNDIYCDGGILDNLPIDSVIDMDLINNTNTINNNSITEPITEPITTPKPNTKPELINETTQTKSELINKTIQTKDVPKDNNIDQNKEEKESLSVIGFYLINQGQTVNKDNYKSINITEYINLFTRTLSKCIINRKIEKTKINKNKYKIINIEIPCDIMSFLKISATHSDIDDIIKIAYNVTLTNLE
jgi:predicted acylesterase/phospholipase RssA